MRAPVESRELFYSKLPDGSFYLLDWCLVNITGQGAMIEQRPEIGLEQPSTAPELNLHDVAFTKISEIDENTFSQVMGGGGQRSSNIRTP